MATNDTALAVLGEYTIQVSYHASERDIAYAENRPIKSRGHQYAVLTLERARKAEDKDPQPDVGEYCGCATCMAYLTRVRL